MTMQKSEPQGPEWLVHTHPSFCSRQYLTAFYLSRFCSCTHQTLSSLFPMLCLSALLRRFCICTHQTLSTLSFSCCVSLPLFYSYIMSEALFRLASLSWWKITPNPGHKKIYTLEEPNLVLVLTLWVPGTSSTKLSFWEKSRYSVPEHFILI